MYEFGINIGLITLAIVISLGFLYVPTKPKRNLRGRPRNPQYDHLHVVMEPRSETDD